MTKIVFVLLVISTLISGCDEKQGATEEAHRWCNELGLRPDAISCVNYDTNADGYVSCSLRFGERIKQIECRGTYSQGHGCRESKSRSDE